MEKLREMNLWHGKVMCPMGLFFRMNLGRIFISLFVRDTSQSSHSCPYTASPSPCTCRTLCSPSTRTSPPGSQSGGPALVTSCRYVNYDSWWYHKGEGLGVQSWTPLPQVGGATWLLQVFPDGLPFLYNQTGWRVAAHNRFHHLRTIAPCVRMLILSCSFIPLQPA